ncbi:MAG: hypothetical protein C4558_02470 [Dehalococcoidia bacterium]|nr:MAG: hypothetical protein C4558_02470 [Dehalococcoidia bacterium]
MPRRRRANRKQKSRRRAKAQPLDATSQSVALLTGEARRALRTGYRSADAGARGIAQTLTEREQRTPQNYANIEAETAKARANVERTLAGLSSAADPVRAVIASEQGSGLERAARAKAAELEDISRQRTSAERQRLAQRAAARKDYNETIGTISGEVSKLESEKLRLRQQDINSRRTYRAQKRQQNVTARGQDISSRDRALDRASREEQKALDRAAKRTSGGKPISAGVKSRAKTQLKTALGLAADWPPDSGKPLSKGGKEAQKFVEQAFRRGGIPRPIGQAAAEIRLYGRLKKKTRRRLRRRYGIGGP